MSRVEIQATDADGNVFVGRGNIEWIPWDAGDVGKRFKPSAIHEFIVHESDGTSLGVVPIHGLKK